MAHLYPALMSILLTAHAADPDLVVEGDEPQLSDPGWRGAKAALKHLREREAAALPPAEVCYRELNDGYQLYEVEVDGNEEVTRPIAGAFGAELADASLALPDEPRFDSFMVRPIYLCEHPDSGT